MLISGIQPFTLLDYPGKTSCIIFTAGCNFRCGYCHNPEFVLPEQLAKIKNNFIPEAAVLNFLIKRQGLLEGVVVSGGEPTVQPDLVLFLKKIKALGFKIKLDTNGNKPEIIKQALADNILDYIAMDYKTSAAAYRVLFGSLAVVEHISASVAIIKNSGINYEFRSTLIKEVHSDIILQAMAGELRGAKQWCLQTFRPQETLDPAYQKFHPFSPIELSDLAKKFKSTVAGVFARV